MHTLIDRASVYTVTKHPPFIDEVFANFQHKNRRSCPLSREESVNTNLDIKVLQFVEEK